MKYGLVGASLVHSYSKEIHEALGKYHYELFSLTEEELSGFIEAGDFGGLNVTIPYKKAVIPLCDEITPLAQRIGAVNTLYWQAPADAPAAPKSSARRLVGHNTDYEGFLYAAKRAGISFAGKTVLILGTGGTSLTARNAVSDGGAAMIYIASRRAADDGQAKETDGAVRTDCADGAGATCGAVRTGDMDDVTGAEHTTIMRGAGACISRLCPMRQLTYSELPSVAGNVQIIVNTTPVGTYPHNLASIVSLADFPHCEAVIDVIYNPFRTKLLLDAEKAGLKSSNGLPMLVAQATAAAGYFLGTPGAFESENERIIEALEKKMRNIILIGMPGSGKSTIGRLLAKGSGKQLVDTDERIVERAGMSIPDIFDRFGEKRFRDLESEVIRELGKEHSLIIATGGGAVLRPENVEALRQNGTIIHLTRPVSALSTDGRPLSKDIETLHAMEAARMPIYEAVADVTFDNSENCSNAELAARLAAQLKQII